ncbi:MAG: hypothetical protein QOK02_6553, partial [Mycobacterium sp.]|nr:hypothetical protein [Mycobacterium sp.]
MFSVNPCVSEEHILSLSRMSGGRSPDHWTSPLLSGTSAVEAHTRAMAKSARRAAAHRSNWGVRTTGRSGRQWTACAAAMVVIVSTTFMGTILVQATMSPGYATWQDKTSTLLRAFGMGPALDRVETWLYTRSAPSDTPPD